MTTYTTTDGRVWDLGEQYTANGFHYRWDGMPFGEGGPFMAAVGRHGVFVPLEDLAALDGKFRDADVAEGAVPDHEGSSIDDCPRCRILRGEQPLDTRPLAAASAVPAFEMRTVEVA
jgi:hypothetical protein